MTHLAASQLLHDAKWEDLLPRLLLSAYRLHRRTLAYLPGAPEPEDLVQDAVTDLLTGRRTLPDDIPLLTVLYGIVRSRASNYLARATAPHRSGGGRRRTTVSPSYLPAAGQSSDAAERNVMHEQLHAVASGDDVVGEIVDLLCEDPALRPADLAAVMGMPVREIYQAKRRLRRRLAHTPFAA